MVPGSGLLDVIVVLAIGFAAFEQLEDRYRAPLSLFHIEGLSYQEVAESMELSVMAVKSLLTRARVKIKEKLAPFLREESRDAV